MSTAPDLPDLLHRALSTPPAARCCVGLSGGLDSSVLLHALATLIRPRQPGFELRAMHAHHGLSAQADAWAEHCARLCENLQVPLRVERVRVDPASGDGPEAAARHARRRAFARHLAADEALVLAHHLSDQAETFLMRLARHSGAEGLSAMRPLAPLEHSQAVVWRPLLAIPRELLSRYAERVGLQWIDDPANVDPRHPRNRLRHEALPVLRSIFPDFETAAGVSAALLQGDDALLTRAAGQALASVQGVDPSTLLRERLMRLDRPMQARVVRLWTQTLGLQPPGKQALDRVLDWVAEGGEPGLQCWPGVRVQRYRDLLHAEADAALALPESPIAWDGRMPLTWGLGQLRLEGPPSAARNWSVRQRLGGERIVLPGRQFATPLKNVLQHLGIPPWERDRLPLLLDASGTLLAAGDLVLGAGIQSELADTGHRLVWIRDDECRPPPQSR